MIFHIDKRVGETPLEAMNRFIAENHHSAEVKEAKKWSYFGRLDPMASGLLILGTDEDLLNDSRTIFSGADKKYEFGAILGITSDTYDALGVAQIGPLARDLSRSHETNPALEALVKEFCHSCIGTRRQEYPLYSSPYLSAGKDRSKRLYKDVEIKSLQYHGHSQLSIDEFATDIRRKISLVHGDFRQVEILDRWETIFESLGGRTAKLVLLDFSAIVSSGTYIRSIVHELGQYLGTGALAYRIRRTGYCI